MSKSIFATFLAKKKRHFVIKFFAFIINFAFSLGVLGVLAGVGILTYYSLDLPNIYDIDSQKNPQSTEIYDRDGNLLYIIHGRENRTKVPLENISEHLRNATIAWEDSRFYQHPGFDIKGLIKAVQYEFFDIGTRRGGSTITQQYIKNTYLSPERDYERKIRELLLAIRFERHYSKDKILELYLNDVPYGNNAYGAEKAAEIYFNKAAKDLTIAEASVLAALPQAPTTYSPFGNNRNSHLKSDIPLDELSKRNITKEQDLRPEEFTRGLLGAMVQLADGTEVYISGKTDLIINRMEVVGYITPEQKKEAFIELQNLKIYPYQEDIKYPHFVFHVKEELEKKYGQETVENGGLKVYTTIDPELQDFAQEVVNNYRSTNLNRFGANNAATISLNPRTGEILTMVGSVDYFDTEVDGNVNVTTRIRQPGSSFKPIAYAQAFNRGFAPGHIIYDIPSKIGPRYPQNYDGRYKGKMTMRRALAQSRNIPAIKAYYLGGEQSALVKFASQLGITTLDPEHDYGYPLSLGAGEVPPLEMAQAYGVFANGGVLKKATGILKVTDVSGNIIEELSTEPGEQVMNSQVAYLISSILSDRGAAIGPRLFVDGQINAAKTGTSTKATKGRGVEVRPGDVWTIGYTPSIVTAVWVGNTKGEGLGFSANGYDTAAPMFKEIMTEALKNSPAEPFTQPEGLRFGASKASSAYNSTVKDVYASFSLPAGTSVISAGRSRGIPQFIKWYGQVQAYKKAQEEEKKEEEEKKKQEEEEKKKAEEELQKIQENINTIIENVENSENNPTPPPEPETPTETPTDPPEPPPTNITPGFQSDEPPATEENNQTEVTPEGEVL